MVHQALHLLFLLSQRSLQQESRLSQICTFQVQRERAQKKGGMFEHQNDLAVLKTHFVCLQNLWGYCKPSTIRKGFQFTWQKLSFDIAICSHDQNTFTSILTTLSQGQCVNQSWCLHQNKEGIMRVEGIDNQKPYLDLLESFISSAETQACTFTFWANCHHHLLQDHCRMLLPARSVLGNCLLALVLVLYNCRFINLMDLQISLGTLSPSAANSLSNNSSLLCPPEQIVQHPQRKTW